MVFKTKTEKRTLFKRNLIKAIKQTSKFTKDITKNRQKKITYCMPLTAVSPNFKARQLGLVGPK